MQELWQAHSSWALPVALPGGLPKSQPPFPPAVFARDGGVPPHQAKASVRILVADENDHAPAFQSDTYTLEVPENQSQVEVITVCATDPDTGENGRLSYQLTGGSSQTPLWVNQHSCAVPGAEGATVFPPLAKVARSLSKWGHAHCLLSFLIGGGLCFMPYNTAW